MYFFLGSKISKSQHGSYKIYEEPSFCPDLLISLVCNQDKPFAQKKVILYFWLANMKEPHKWQKMSGSLVHFLLSLREDILTIAAYINKVGLYSGDLKRKV